MTLASLASRNEKLLDVLALVGMMILVVCIIAAVMGTLAWYCVGYCALAKVLYLATCRYYLDHNRYKRTLLYREPWA